MVAGDIESNSIHVKNIPIINDRQNYCLNILFQACVFLDKAALSNMCSSCVQLSHGAPFF